LSTVVLMLLAMLVIVLMAGLVILYVAYPRRGEEVPNAAWIGDALRRGVAKLPTLANQGGPRQTRDRSEGRSRRLAERQIH
jgi:hypothetical protein